MDRRPQLNRAMSYGAPNRARSDPPEYTFAPPARVRSVEWNYFAPGNTSNIQEEPEEIEVSPPIYEESTREEPSRDVPPPLYERRRGTEIIETPDERRIRATAFLDALRIYTIYEDFHPEDASDIKDPFELQSSKIDNATEQTCQWILERQEFVQWRRGNSAPVLIVLANPGSGKSVLAKSLSKELNDTSEQPVAFYCSRSISRRNDTMAVIASFVYKLIEENHNLVRFVSKSLLDIYPSFATMWELFLRIISDTTLKNRIFIIDGLDECKRASQVLLQESLQNAYYDISVKILITARNESVPRTIAADFNYILIKPEDISQDIATYLNAQFNDNDEALPEETLSSIRQYIEESAEGSFLITSLRMEQYRKAKRDPNLSRGLNDVTAFFTDTTRDLNDYYGDMIDDIVNRDPQNILMAASILNILLAAQAPLDEVDLAHAILFGLRGNEYHNIASSRGDFDQTMFTTAIELCGSLVTIKEGRMSIVHSTAMEYLSHPDQVKDSPKRLDFLTSLVATTKGHIYLTRACMKVLSFPDVEFVDRTSFMRYPLFLYALQQWRIHLTRCNENIMENIDENLLKRFFAPESEALKRWTSFMKWVANDFNPVSPDLKTPNALNIIATTGLTGLLDLVQPATGGEACTLFGDKLELDHVDDVFEHIPLVSAAVRGDIEMVQRLMKLGCSPSARAPSGVSALDAALIQGWENVAQALIDHDPGCVDSDYLKENGECSGPPLFFAIASEKPEIVKFLIDRGAKNGIRGGTTNSTVLHEAAVHGNIDIMNLLFDHELVANVDATNFRGCTALQIAAIAESGDPLETVKLLLAKGANVNGVNDDQYSPLSNACVTGNLDMARLLLQNNANIAKEFRMWTALHIACNANFKECVELLIDYETPLNAVTDDGKTALRLAVDQQQTDLVRLLLQHKADPDIVDGDGRTAVNKSVAMEDTEILDLLIQAGADVNLHPTDGITPLHTTAHGGNEAIARQLLAAGAHIDAIYPSANWTPLLVALNYGHAEFAAFLLDQGASPDIISVSGWTALHYACHKTKSKELVDRLITSCDPTALTTDGYSALILAAEQGFVGAIEALLNTGEVDTLHADKYDQTPLFKAALSGSSECVSLLLQQKFDANAMTLSGFTALHAAAETGNVDVVKQLLAVSKWTYRKRSIPTPLTVAVFWERILAAMALLDAGMSPQLYTSTGHSPLHEACEIIDENLLQKLIEKGADSNERAYSNLLPWHRLSPSAPREIVELLMPTKSQAMRTRTDDLTNPLFFACTRTLREVREIQELKSFSPTVPNAFDIWPLCEAVECSRLEIIRYLLAQDSSHINKVSMISHRTALGVAGICEDEEATLLLLRAGADPNIPDFWGNRPVIYASRYEPCFRLLTEATDGIGEVIANSNMYAKSNVLSQLCVLLEYIKTRKEARENQFSESESAKCWLLLCQGFSLLSEDEDATIALESLFGKPTKSMAGKSFTCDRCFKKKRECAFFCNMCFFRMLCEDCMTKSLTGERFRSCTSHSFTQVPRDNWFSRPSDDFSGDGKKEQEWLDATIEKYQAKRDASIPPAQTTLPPLKVNYTEERPNIFDLLDFSKMQELQAHIKRYPRDLVLLNDDDQTTLTAILKNGAKDEELLEMLVLMADAGSVMLAPYEPETCPLNIAVERGFSECAAFLLDNFDHKFDEKNNDGPRLLKIMVHNGWEAAVTQAVLKHFDWVAKDEFEYLKEQSKTGLSDADIVRRLLSGESS